MQIKADSPDEYISLLPDERKPVIIKLREVINSNIPEGFEETMNYGMIGWVIPHSTYPNGYHADPKQPLPFINISSQKNHVAVYHSGVYSDENLFNWFTSEYKNLVPGKLDMGKSCIRYKKMEVIPYELIGELSGKMSSKKWIELYEDNLHNNK
jgi:uncharacterized protein YdhG (YjbR/CyaY superfamily)